MAATREALAELFFGGDGEAARCLFEKGRDQRALHIPGGALKNPVLSVGWWGHISTLLDNHDIGPFEFDVIQEGRPTDTRTLLDPKSRPSVAAIDQAIRQGATLRVYGVSRFDGHCASQLQMLRQVLKRDGFVNLYLTPPNTRGLKLHYDLEDSLAVQLKGEKHWKLYNGAVRYPTQLPPGPPAVREETAQIIHMRPGDVLFVPSGLPHTVETRESLSQHMTFGVHVTRQLSLLSALLDEFAAGEEELRRPVRSDEDVTRAQLATWAGQFEKWLRRGS